MRLFVFLLSCLFIQAAVHSQNITLKQIGKNNLLFNILGGDPLNGILYTIDYDGTVNKTTLDSGVHTRLANTSYKRGEKFFGLNNKLYLIEEDGKLNEINPVTGAWKALTAMGVWTKIEKTVVVNNVLYTTENGVLYRHRGVDIDNRVVRGDAEFYNVGSMFDADNSLYCLFGDGSFYEINTSDAKWRRIGKGKSWKALKCGDIVGGKFFSVDITGNFTETLLSDGTKKTLDTEQFKKAKFMFVEAGKLYVIMTDGNLYEVLFP